MYVPTHFHDYNSMAILAYIFNAFNAKAWEKYEDIFRIVVKLMIVMLLASANRGGALSV